MDADAILELFTENFETNLLDLTGPLEDDEEFNVPIIDNDVFDWNDYFDDEDFEDEEDDDEEEDEDDEDEEEDEEE